MEVEILDPSVAAKVEASANSKPVPVATTLRIEGRDRPAMQVTVGGHTVVYTERLSVIERRSLSRAMPSNDVTALEAYGFNQAAARVRQIDGEPIGFPAKDADIVAILEQLGDDAAEFLYDQGIMAYQDRMKADLGNESQTQDSKP